MMLTRLKRADFTSVDAYEHSVGWIPVVEAHGLPLDDGKRKRFPRIPLSFYRHALHTLPI